MKLPDGNAYGFMDTYGAISECYLNQGKLPTSAAEILSLGWSPEKLEQVAGLPKDAQMSRLGHLIDPSTGKLFTSFADTTWTPFGISVEVVPEEQWKNVVGTGVERPVQPRTGQPEFSTRAVYHIIRWGEEPNSKLQDFYLSGA
jgi:hypothetical protein